MSLSFMTLKSSFLVYIFTRLMNDLFLISIPSPSSCTKHCKFSGDTANDSVLQISLHSHALHPTTVLPPTVAIHSRLALLTHSTRATRPTPHPLPTHLPSSQNPLPQPRSLIESSLQKRPPTPQPHHSALLPFTNRSRKHYALSATHKAPRPQPRPTVHYQPNPVAITNRRSTCLFCRNPGGVE